MIQAMQREVAIQARYLAGQPIETIYFGGGTPSLLTAAEIQLLMDSVTNHFDVLDGTEVTIEANPDDLSTTKIQELAATPINRFSIGIQSFFEEDLRWMNRAHNAAEAQAAILRVQDAGYGNITADLIYGFPLLTDAKWQDNIGRLVDTGVPHISAYGMTVEPRTALSTFIRNGKQPPMDDGQGARQFEYLMDALALAGYVHYEISNFAKPPYYARHNSNYWKAVPYLGIGPSAHSYDGTSRQWNVRNNAMYIRALEADELPCEKEILTETDRLNEYIMTSLRTIWGLDLADMEARFGTDHSRLLRKELKCFLEKGEVALEGQTVTLTRKGKLMADHIAASLFFA